MGDPKDSKEEKKLYNMKNKSSGITRVQAKGIKMAKFDLSQGSKLNNRTMTPKKSITK